MSVEKSMRYFVLQGHDTIEVPEKAIWREWMRKHIKDRIVNRTKIGREYHVVTIFTGKSEETGELGIFSTAVFPWSSSDTISVFRWDNWSDSERGHDAIVRRVTIRLAIEQEYGGYPCRG